MVRSGALQVFCRQSGALGPHSSRFAHIAAPVPRASKVAGKFVLKTGGAIADSHFQALGVPRATNPKSCLGRAVTMNFMRTTSKSKKYVHQRVTLQFTHRAKFNSLAERPMAYSPLAVGHPPCSLDITSLAAARIQDVLQTVPQMLTSSNTLKDCWVL